MRRCFMGFLLGLLVLLAVLPSYAMELTILGRPDAIDEMTLLDFEDEFGCTVTLGAANAPDLLLLDGAQLHAMMMAGQLQPLPDLPDRDVIGDFWTARVDDLSPYVLPYLAQMTLNLRDEDDHIQEAWTREAYFLQLQREEDRLSPLDVICPENPKLQIEGFAIPSGTVHPFVYDFLSFMLRPDVGAHCAEEQGCLCLNEEGMDYLSAQYLNNPISCPAAETLEHATPLW